MKKLVSVLMLCCLVINRKLIHDPKSQPAPDRSQLHRRLISTKDKQQGEQEIQDIMVQLSKHEITEDEAKRKLKKKKIFGAIWDGVKSAASAVGSAVGSAVTALTGLGAEGPPIHKDSPNVFMLPIINPIATSSGVISPAAATELDKPSSYPTVHPLIQMPAGADSKDKKDDKKDDKKEDKEEDKDEEDKGDKKDDVKDEEDKADGAKPDGAKPDGAKPDDAKTDRKLKKKEHKNMKGYVKGLVDEDSDSGAHHHHHKKNKH